MAQTDQKVDEKQGAERRIGGYLHRVVPIADKSGEIISYALKPLMVEFKVRDVIQVMIGSALMATPVSMSEEAWNLARDLPKANMIAITSVSLLLVAAFVFYNFYRHSFKGHVFDFVKRVLGTYLLTFIVVAAILTVLQKCPWEENLELAFRRIVIVAFPAVMGATLSDMVK